MDYIKYSVKENNEMFKHFYQNEVPWILDNSDLKIIRRNHLVLSRYKIRELLWEKASK